MEVVADSNEGVTELEHHRDLVTEKNKNVDYKLSGLQEELSEKKNARSQSQQEKVKRKKYSYNLKFASQEQKTVMNAQLPDVNMENLRTEREQHLEKLDVTHPGVCPWAETEEKTWNELQEALDILKAAKMICHRIQRIELENSNLIVTTEKQAREMEALWEKLLNAGAEAVEAAPKGDPGKRREDAAVLRSQAELTKLTSALSEVRMQDDTCKMEVEKYKKLYLKELRSNNALLSLLPSRTCKCPKGLRANLEEEMRQNTSAMVTLVGPHPKCPQVRFAAGANLTSSSMESQGSVPHTSQSPEGSCEFMENPSLSEDQEKARRKLISSVHSLLCALRREARRTTVLEKELTEIKKILNMLPKEGHRCDSRRHSFREVSKASQAEMNSPVGGLRLEGEAAAKENLVHAGENPSVAVLTQMELEMKDIEAAISEENIQELLVKRELEVWKKLYRGEIEQIDGMPLELRV
ncbi:ankyrin repeat domain-containing protein 26 [Peromyscus leucopus]|uniref:ankyrin repeat domain-containing protein 26 n=1 Tax=Peromyscus leucopus TaxID=10041 RepID=UPI001885619D|nr:ankyrin repeat domain-containing protein 26 [Peromyscus leucopus]XP_037062282.1 ankyrin repeat domain-containing protein 26 [Peromyscus leucopus]